MYSLLPANQNMIGPKLTDTTSTFPIHVAGPPESPSEQLSIADFQRILEWSGPEAEIVDQCIHDLFAQQVTLRPKATAVEAWDGFLTYAELDALSNTLAVQLIDLGVGPETIVPFCFFKSKWVPVCLLGILRAGAACAALDPELPRNRLAEIVAQSGAKTIAASPNCSGSVVGLAENVHFVDESLRSAPQSFRASSGTRCQPQNAAVVQFTSGSTGTPKGILLQHNALCSSFAAFGHEWNISPSSRVFQFSAHTFDVAISDILGTLTRGGCICIPSEDERRNDLEGAISRMRANWALFTPSLAKVVRPEYVPTLQTLVVGGEAVTRENLSTWADHCDLILAYGLAEASIYCMGTKPMTAHGDPSCIGRPIGCRVWICRADLEPVRVGEIGELLLDGPILARNYLGDSTKTARTFVPTPTWLQPHSSASRLLRTGDLVRYCADGTLQYLGRGDDQVKLRGIRIELGDIEHHLKVDFGQYVKDVAVELIAPNTDKSNPQLIAVVVPATQDAHRNGSLLTLTKSTRQHVESALAHARKCLPSYMLPTAFLAISYMPMTPSKKRDRQALRAFLQDVPSDLIQQYTVEVGPVNEVEDSDYGTEFWTSYLKDASPIPFPVLLANRVGCRELQRIKHVARDLPLGTSALAYRAVLTAAWALLIGRHSESKDVVFGGSSPSHALVPLRKKVHPYQTLSEFVKSTQQDLLEIDSMPSTSIAQIKLLAPDISTSCNFNNAILLHHDQSSVDHGLLLVLRVLDDVQSNSHVFSAEFDASVLTSTFLEHLLAQFEHVLRQILQFCNATTTLDAVDFFSPLDRQLISKLNSREFETLNSCVHQEVAKRRAEHPERVAIHAWDAQLSYAELDHFANRLAQNLKALGLSPQTYVAFCLDKGAFGIVVELGIMKAGAAFVALSAEYPQARLEEILSDANVQVIVTNARHKSRFKNGTRTVIVLDDSYWAKTSDAALEDVVLPNSSTKSACALVYTSGSSGKPKGVVLEHESLCTSVRALGRSLYIDKNSRILQFSAWTFGASIGEVYATLFYGGCVCVPAEQDYMEDLAGAINRFNCNWAWLTSSVISLISPSQVPGLKTLCLGGEAAKQDDVRKWANDVCLIITYGQTEGTVRCACFAGLTVETPATTIGQGYVANLWIIEPDNHDRLAPVGAVGEIAVEGPVVARGYLNVVDKEVFIEDPPWLGQITGKRERRVLKTGDLARYDANGNLVLVGRRDGQRKVHGIRIEVGEIENQLNRLVYLRRAVVDIVKYGPDQRQILVAFVLTDEQNSFSNIELMPFGLTDGLRRNLLADQNMLLEQLPEYMLPSHYIPVRKLPTTTSRKCDRKSLISRVETMAATELAEYLLGASSTKLRITANEKLLARLWASVLSVDDAIIGRDSSFFALGGKSIQAMQLVASARSQGMHLAVATIFEQRTLSAMALHLKAIDPVSGDFEDFSPKEGELPAPLVEEVAGLCRLSEEAVEDIYSCTPMQAALLSSSAKAPDAYCRHIGFTLPDGIRLSAFRQAWNQVILLNPILRTRIVECSAGFVQVVVKDEGQWKEYKSIEQAVEDGRFNITKRGAALLCFAALPDQTAILSIHHAVFDGWSLGSLVHDVTEILLGNSPQSRVSYRQFVNYCCNNLKVDEAISYWADRLIEGNTARFPEVPPKHTVRIDATAEQSIEITERSTQACSASLATLAQATWAILSKAYSDMDNITFGLTVSGRNAPVPGIESISGPTITTVPMQLSMRPGTTINSLTDMIQDQTISMIPYEQLGLDLIGKASDEALQAVDFQTLFVVQPNSSVSGNAQSVGIKVQNHNRPAITTYPLTLECRSTPSGFNVVAHFDSFIISRVQMARLLNQFKHTLLTLCTAPGSSVLSDLTWLTREDEAEIAQWNSNSKIAEPVDTCIHELISLKAKQRPHSIAVHASDGELSYEALDQNSSRIGCQLVRRGVRIGARVPFIFEKSLWATVAVLAILKAGGVCVPIDPGHPDARKKSIVEKAQASLVLASTSVEMAWCEGVSILTLGWTETTPLTKMNSDQPKLPICPQDIAYMLFTSGSISEPKGVIWNHRTVSTTLLSLGRYWNFHRGIRVLQYAAHVFDISAFEMLGTLAFGGCVCIPSDQERAERLTNFISRKAVDWAALTPTVLRTIDPRSVHTLRTLVSIGEPINRRIVDLWAGKLSLFNGYGPCEACIFTTLASVSPDTRYPESIGLPLGCAVWIVDREDVNKLVPIGFPGEIVVEGYNVGVGYFPPDSKTANTFIPTPRWAPTRSKSTVGWYHTGDIGSYNSDGSISLLGRNDDQVKIRGQRFRLSEVEKVMNKHDDVAHIVVTIPKTGALSARLTAVLALTSLETNAAKPLEPLLPKDQAAGVELLEKITVHASAELPLHMVPIVWLLVQAMPKTSSGKLDRLQIKQWLLHSDLSTFPKAGLLAVQNSSTSDQLQSADERILQSIWSTVLNLPLQQIGRDSSFIKLGGDSISAMQVASKCKARNLPLSVGDVIQCGTLARLAQRIADARVSNPEASWQNTYSVQEDKRDFKLLRATNDEAPSDTLRECGLSPIQALLTEDGGPASHNHFNQSYIFELTKEVSHSSLQKALAALSNCHAMLKARFRQDERGRWIQSIDGDGNESVRLTSHKVNSISEAESVVSAAQASLNIVSGPVFTVELIQAKTGCFKHGVLFAAAHHLVVDLVSWRIITEDLTGILEGSKVALPKSMSFIDWVKNQERFTKKVLLPVHMPTPPHCDLNFWGMKGSKNLRRDIVTRTFSLCAHSSSTLLTDQCHTAYGTTTLDLLLAATLGSFVRAFPDRGVPAFYNESFGREPWDDLIDPSRTVGWFTTLYPVVPNIDATSHLHHVVRATKDSRLEYSKNGWGFFTASMLSQTPLHRSNFEILFNYSGYVKQVDGPSRLLRRLPRGTISAEDVAPDVEMFGLINIAVQVVDGKLQFSLMYNKNMAHVDRLELWARDLQTTLLALVVLLERRSSQLTLADLPMLRIGYSDLDLLNGRLRDTGLRPENIESIYSCSPVQEGILLAQIQQPDKYWTLGSFKITSLSEFDSLSVGGLAKAWELVCESHSILRTVFVNDLLRDRAFHQVVLHQIVPSVSFHEFSDAADIGTKLRNLPLQRYRPNEPQHHLSICVVGDQIYFRMEGNHALHDAAGIQLMCEELAHALDAEMPLSRKSNYASYISWIEQQRKPALRWWKKHMLGSLPCLFPRLQDETPENEGQCAASAMGKVRVEYAVVAEILAFCQCHGFTISTLFQAAWAIVLHEYTGDKSVCFGYLANGRDAPVENIDHLVGPTINLLVCRLDIQPNDSMINFLYRIQDTFAQCLSHQAFSLTELQHTLNFRGKPLFNTAMSVQRVWAADLGGQGDSKIELVDFHDPSEYDVVLAVTYSSESLQTVIKFKESHLSPFFVNALAETVSSVVTKISRHRGAAPDNLDVVDIETREKLVELNCKDEALHYVDDKTDQTTRTWQAPVSVVECELHRVWCEALRVPPERIGIFDTFRRVGGDSLTAIQIVARCRQRGLNLSVQLIFQSNGIADLAERIERLGLTRAVDVADAPFELSPIQKTAIEGKATPENHHAMSFLLRVRRRLQLDELEMALKLLTERHPMLRARFMKPAQNWMQVLSADVNGSFTCLHQRDKKLEDLDAVFRNTQKGINVHSGPIGAAILCDVDEGQFLFLTIHHLVVDPVSYQILIRDLTQALTDGFLPPQKSLSYRCWIARQAELAKTLRIEDCLPYQVPSSNYDYWGMLGLSNRAGDAVVQEFQLSEEVTYAVVKDSVGFLDTLIGTALCAFSHCFPDRTTLPAVFTDSHGRETWEGEDVLETVGWFTSIFPIALQPHVDPRDVTEVVQHVKALRRSLPRNGCDYFMSRWLSTEGREAFAQHFPIEIMCHYYGSAYRELENPDALFSRVSRDAVPLHPASDDFEVLALLSLVAEVQDGQLRVFVGYSKDIGRLPQIRKWVWEMERLLNSVSCV